MRFSSLTAIVILAIACISTTAQAQCDSQCAQSAAGCRGCQHGCHHGCNHCCNMPLLEAFCMGYRANRDWPAQYIPAARRGVHSFYDVMVHNGWRRQNLLGTYHFDPQTDELTDAGKLKVNWILSQTPHNRRTIYVQRGLAAEQTADRIASVQHWAGDRSPAIGTVDVYDTHIVAEGRSAGTVDNVFTNFQTNQMPPVLPATSGSSTSTATAQ